MLTYIYKLGYINWCQVKITPYTSAANRIALLLFVRRFPLFPLHHIFEHQQCEFGLTSILPPVRLPANFFPFFHYNIDGSFLISNFFCLFSHLSFRKGKVHYLHYFIVVIVGGICHYSTHGL